MTEMRTADIDSPAHKLLASKRPLVIAHRGYSQLAPENTLPSFNLAIAAGADLIELDCHHSKDGQLIVIHDHKLNRTTDAAARWRKKRVTVEHRTAEEIQSLDAGSWFSPKFGGVKVPLLAEALDAIQPASVPLIERKTGDPAACIKLLREKNLINRVIVQSFDWKFLREFHEHEPSQILGALGPPAFLANGRKPIIKRRRLVAAWLNALEKTGAKIVVWSRRVSKHSVRLAHERGLLVWVYTINSSALAHRLLNIGVDGLITDDLWGIHTTLGRRTNPQK